MLESTSPRYQEQGFSMVIFSRFPPINEKPKLHTHQIHLVSELKTSLTHKMLQVSSSTSLASWFAPA